MNDGRTFREFARRIWQRFVDRLTGSGAGRPHWFLRRPVLAIFLAALAVRVALVVILAVAFEGGLFEDESTYGRMAETMASGETGRWDEYTHGLFWETAGFTIPLTAVYWLTGSSALAGQLLVALFGALAAALTTRVALEHLGAGWSLLAGGIVGLLPSVVLWSSLTLKDPAVWAALTAIALTVALASNASGRRLLLLALAGGAALWWLGHMRLHTTVVAAWAIAIASWFGLRDRRPQRVAGGLAITILVPWLVGAGPAGVTFVADQGKPLELRRVQNAESADTAFIAPVKEIERVEGELAGLRHRAAALERRATLLERRAGELMRDNTGEAPDTPEKSPAPEATPRDDDPATPEKSPAPEATPVDDDPDTPEKSPDYEATPVSDDPEELLALAEELRAEAKQYEAEAEEVIRSRPHLANWFGGRLDRDLSGGLREDLKALPRGLVVMLLEPYPWRDTANLRMNLARAESFLWWPILALALIGVASVRRHPGVLVFPLVAGAGIATMYALVEGNFGTAFRHRAEFIWAVALLAAFGARSLGSWIQARRAARVQKPDRVSSALDA